MLLLICQSTWATVKDGTPALQSASKEPLTTAYMGQLVLSLLFIIGLIIVLAWMLKKMNVIPQQGQGIIKIVSTVSVGSRDRISLIQVGEEQIVIALSPGRITKLHDMASPVAHVEPPQAAQPFAKTLNSMLQKHKSQKNSEQDTENG